ncbi:MAG: IS110 family transposase [Desulfobulbaceae bacterium]|nr:IS110 family transposase [Desulfobulbaceae bacterium]
MKKTIKYIGLDVHKKSISIGVADEGRDGDVRYYGKIENDMNQLDKVIRKLISKGAVLRFVYEAGPCGYAIYRYLNNNGIDCVVIAPSKIPTQRGDRVKNDKRDCLSLARLHRAGELTVVYVPTEDDGALRDLVRAREDAVRALRLAKQQLGAFLLRHDIVYSGKSKWSKAYFNWLADIAMPHPAQQIVFQEYIDTVSSCSHRVQRLTEQVHQQSRQHELIQAFQSMRGISLIVAATVAAELGDLSRFESPGKLMAFLGLIPSEHSSGERVNKGSITKTGNRHVRKALITAAHAYRFPARKSRAIRNRQENLPEGVTEISWKAQCRLCTRYHYLTAKGKSANVAKTAIAREIAGFSWAIAQELSKAA